MNWDAEDTLRDYALKLDRVYQVHGRDGLKGYTATDVCILYMHVQHDLDTVNDKIEGGDGQELDLLVKERLSAQLQDLRADLNERHDREPQQEMER